MATIRTELVFADENAAVSFVKWIEGDGGYGAPAALDAAANSVNAELEARGWTRHGYANNDWCPPGRVYDRNHGCLEPDDPLVIAGRWVCSCGYTTDRMAHALGHCELARQGVKLQGDPDDPHLMNEIERRGAEAREYDD